MRKTIVLIGLVSIAHILSAQKQDNIWVLGKCGSSQSAPNDEWGVSILDFSNIDKPQVIEKQEYAVNFTATNASICDSLGNLKIPDHIGSSSLLVVRMFEGLTLLS